MMNQYEQSLLAMEHLLNAVGEVYWAQWIHCDIEQWRSDHETSHHLSAYGGMGTLNDVVICRTNQHNITELQEPWVNILFEWLTSICHYLAQHPDDWVTAETLSNAVGKHDSALAAFIGGDKAPSSMRGLASENRRLEGWRCLRCGHSKVSNYNIECFIADALLPFMVFRYCETLTLDRLVDRIIAQNIIEIEPLRKKLITAVKTSGISFSDRSGWLPCPCCGEDDSAINRWKLVADDTFHFTPSDDNLPLRQ